MPKYRHFLFRPKKQAFPRAALFLSVAYHFAGAAAGRPAGSAVLDKWAIVLATPGPNGWGVARESEGTDAAGFWKTVEQAATRSAGVWVFSWDFRKCAALLRLWDKMEQRYVRLDGSDAVGGVGLRRVVSDVQGARDTDHEQRPGQQGESGVPKVRNGGCEGGDARIPKRARPRLGARGYCVLEDPPVHLVFRVGNGSTLINWVDAANYGLTSPGEGVGPLARSRSLAEWFRAAASTLFSLGPCGWSATAGSQAMHLFRSAYIREPIFSHADPVVTAMESQALFGGRAECFALGRVRQGVFLYDYRSLYPNVCAALPVPVRLVGELRDPTDAARLHDAPGVFVMARVDVETSDADYPYRSDKGVIYPTGRFTTVLCGHELSDAITAGVVRRFRAAATWEASPVLGPLSEALYRVRKGADVRGDRLLSEWAKSLAVSLFGKFAQRERWWESRPDAECPYPWWEGYAPDATGEYRRNRVLAGRTAVEHTAGFAHGTLPAVTCAVTAAGRVRLLAALRAAGRPNVYYCDTDAVIVNAAGRRGLVGSGLCHESEWGRLRLLEESSECVISGLRYYTIGARARESGRPRGELLAAAPDGSVAVWPWIGHALRTQTKPTAAALYVPYCRAPSYEGGRCDESGEVRPFQLDQWEEG